MPVLFPEVAQAGEYINKITPGQGLKGEKIYNARRGSGVGVVLGVGVEEMETEVDPYRRSGSGDHLGHKLP